MRTKMDKTIGFVGLGIMGRPMALNLISAGYQLVCYNYNQHAVAFAQTTGIECLDSLKTLASMSDVIITILPDSPQVKAVALGKDGLIEGLKPGQLYVDMSTIDAETIRLIEQTFKQKG
jgi:2-hydroxy-3-oxopropionate reductase